MKELIPMDEYGVFADGKDTAKANSLIVAKMFGKNRKSVLRAIKNMDCSEDFWRRNFEPSKRLVNKRLSAYNRNGERNLYTPAQRKRKTGKAVYFLKLKTPVSVKR